MPDHWDTTYLKGEGMLTKADIERLQKSLKDKQYVESATKSVAYKLADAMIGEATKKEEGDNG